MAITCAFCWRSVSRRVKFGVLIKVFSNKIIVPLVAQGLPSSFFSSLLRKFTIYCSVSTVIPYWQKYKMQTMHRKSRIWEMKNDNYTNCFTQNQVCAMSYARYSRKCFIQIYKALYRDAMLVSLWGHKYGGRKATETSAFEFSYKRVNSSLEELITVKVVFVLGQGIHIAKSENRERFKSTQPPAKCRIK